MTVGTKHARFGTPRTSAEEGGETQRSHSGQLLEVVRRETVPRCITLRRGYSNPTLRTLAGAGGASYQLGLAGGTVLNEHAQIDEASVLIDTLR
jgi:hypothetical protein